MPGMKGESRSGVSQARELGGARPARRLDLPGARAAAAAASASDFDDRRELLPRPSRAAIETGIRASSVSDQRRREEERAAGVG